MLTELRITNFRALRKLSVQGLTPVSLLVGANNAGKTSVLEAAEMVLGGNTPLVLSRSSLRRKETIFELLEDGSTRFDIEVSHLFFGHAIEEHSAFRIEADAKGVRYFTCRIAPAFGLTDPLPIPSPPQRPRPIDLIGPNLTLIVEGDRLKAVSLPLLDVLLPFGDLRTSASAGNTRDSQGDDTRIAFVGTTSSEDRDLLRLWDQVVLTPEETKVVEVLRIIEPTIERIAALTGSNRAGSRLFLKLRGADQRIPLGSMGEGIKRLLALSLNLVTSAGGYLLVDEIDTGLHHSVMVKMWRLVVEAAKRLNVQVLATTHSLDCVRALAALYEEHRDVRDLISLHRIERNAQSSVPYSADEILAAAQHQMELR